MCKFFRAASGGTKKLAHRVHNYFVSGNSVASSQPAAARKDFFAVASGGGTPPLATAKKSLETSRIVMN